MMTREERIALWRLSPAKFNEWRKNNDIPHLFNFFSDRLPRFKQWITTYFPDMQYLVQQDFPGRLIHGDIQMRVVSYVQENDEQITTALPLEHWISRSIRNRPVKILEDRPYTPYIQWARKRYRGRPFIVSDSRNDTYTDNIRFISWSSPDGSPQNSTAYLFHDHAVLSLGNVELPPGIIINGRNLDFTSLDFLRISGSVHGNTWCFVCPSSCRNVVFNSANHAFMTFQNCPFVNLEVRTSKLQDFEFEFCEITRPEFIDSYISGLHIRDSILTQPSFANTDLYEFKYQPLKHTRPVDTMRRFCEQEGQK